MTYAEHRQLVGVHEVAADRHAIEAMRFLVEGEGMTDRVATPDEAFLRSIAHSQLGLLHAAIASFPAGTET